MFVFGLENFEVNFFELLLFFTAGIYSLCFSLIFIIL